MYLLLLALKNQDERHVKNLLELPNKPRNDHKIVIAGDSNTGKTAISDRLVSNTFIESYEPTIGANFCQKDYDEPDKLIRLMIWSISGQEKYRSLAPMYIKGSDEIIVVFDVTNRHSYDNIEI